MTKNYFSDDPEAINNTAEYLKECVDVTGKK